MQTACFLSTVYARSHSRGSVVGSIAQGGGNDGEDKFKAYLNYSKTTDKVTWPFPTNLRNEITD